jgi:conserved oligomeric Golgi complex subunit 5
VEAPTERISDDISNSNNETELEDAVPNISLRSINAVITHLPAVEAARAKITAEMESMVVQGLKYLVRLLTLASNPADEPVENQSLLASSLQTAFNLRILPTVVEGLVSDLTDVVKTRIKQTFDMARLAKDANIKGQFVCAIWIWR